MPQHGAVDLSKNIAPYVYSVVWGNPDDILIVCRVMDFAETEAILNHRFTKLVDVRDDMCRVQKLRVL